MLSVINLTIQKIGKLNWEGTRETKVTIIKQPLELPRVTLNSNGKNQIDNSTDYEFFVLPNQVIAYSSGQNELISNPFIKSSYRYFEQLEKGLTRDLNLELGLNRLFFLDYDSNHIISICNYLFPQQNRVELITKELELDKKSPLDSFSINIHYKNYRGNKIRLPLSIQQAIENLRVCATAVEEIKVLGTKGPVEEEEIVELKLAFWINDTTREAFERKFGSAISLFRDLYYLNLLNIHLHGVETRRLIKDAPSMTYDNLSHLIPVPPRNKLVITIDKLRFRKNDGELIKYKELSDGEHQLMHVLGSIMLLNTSGSILLYDEPETHFNPEWRSKLISLINRATEEKAKVDKIRKQEILISSHSPFIVSDCRRERVFIFEKGKTRNPDINTFGASVNLLTVELFNKKETIPYGPVRRLSDYYKMYKRGTSVDKVILKIEKELGDSVEKVMAINQLLEDSKTTRKKKGKRK